MVSSSRAIAADCGKISGKLISRWPMICILAAATMEVPRGVLRLYYWVGAASTDECEHQISIPDSARIDELRIGW
jgi:hypothetical protein